MVSSEFLTVVGNVLHINELNIQNAMKYLILKLQQLYSTKIDS